jgi:hypothetical protein
MMMVGTDIVVMTSAFIGACAYFSFKSGVKEGYQKMAREVATSIVEIHMEQQKIELMKLEMAEIQKECEKLIEDNKVVQQ